MKRSPLLICINYLYVSEISQQFYENNSNNIKDLLFMYVFILVYFACIWSTENNSFKFFMYYNSVSYRKLEPVCAKYIFSCFYL